MAKKVSTKKAEKEVQEAPVIIRNEVDQAVEKRLVALYTLQIVDSEIDKIVASHHDFSSSYTLKFHRTTT
jgi:hypothetical protein